MRNAAIPGRGTDCGGGLPRVVAFDVETPNFRNDSMCAIGITVIENGVLGDTYTSLVDPETFFDPFNVRLTGITPETVRRAPNFQRLWIEIGPVLTSGILIAHNAAFDLRVLASCVRRYGVDAPRRVPYACTVRMGRRCYPELPNHKLDTLCRYRQIELDHHRAGSDSRACAALFLDYMARGLPLEPFLRNYDLRSMRTALR